MIMSISRITLENQLRNEVESLGIEKVKTVIITRKKNVYHLELELERLKMVLTYGTTEESSLDSEAQLCKRQLENAKASAVPAVEIREAIKNKIEADSALAEYKLAHPKSALEDELKRCNEEYSIAVKKLQDANKLLLILEEDYKTFKQAQIEERTVLEHKELNTVQGLFISTLKQQKTLRVTLVENRRALKAQNHRLVEELCFQEWLKINFISLSKVERELIPHSILENNQKMASESQKLIDEFQPLQLNFNNQLDLVIEQLTKASGNIESLEVLSEKGKELVGKIQYWVKIKLEDKKYEIDEDEALIKSCLANIRKISGFRPGHSDPSSSFSSSSAPPLSPSAPAGTPDSKASDTPPPAAALRVTVRDTNEEEERDLRRRSEDELRRKYHEEVAKIQKDKEIAQERQTLAEKALLDHRRREDEARNSRLLEEAKARQPEQKAHQVQSVARR